MNEYEIALYFMEPPQFAHEAYREYLINCIRSKRRPNQKGFTGYDVDAILDHEIPDPHIKFLATRYGMCLDIRPSEIRELIAATQTSFEMRMLKRSTL